ncbi:hypothetical protein [Nostoc sp.]|uniref:hypothetical protein n=1 Tax=Nostoc sp. TaxID=1180 RepID=UPI002FF66788
MKLATLINKAVLVPCLWMQQMVGAQQWYASTSGTPVRPSRETRPRDGLLYSMQLRTAIYLN